MGVASVNTFTQDVVCKLLEPFRNDGAKALVKAIIARLAGSLSSSMPSDAKHKQHLPCISQWLQAGMEKKRLKMDCGGLTLAVLCVSQLLQSQFPTLRGVRMVVCFEPSACAIWPHARIWPPCPMHESTAWSVMCGRSDVALSQ